MVAIVRQAKEFSLWQQRAKRSRVFVVFAVRKGDSLLDLFPEPATIRNVWKNKLTLVKGERVGAVVATERERQRFAFNIPMAFHELPALVGRRGPVLNSTIDMKDEMLVYRARIADRGFSPMSNQRVRIFRRRGISLLKCNDT